MNVSQQTAKNTNNHENECQTITAKTTTVTHAQDISLFNSCVFYSGRIRTLVAMATYSSHRLIMGKEDIDIFFCLIGDMWNFFTEMFIE